MTNISKAAFFLINIDTFCIIESYKLKEDLQV